MQYTEEQLMKMPMAVLRHVDIDTVEDEKLVQKVLNTRLHDMPMPNTPSFPSYVTNDITVEKEKELQAQIDAKNSEIKKGLLASIDEDDEEDEEEEEVSVAPKTEVVAAVVRYCDYCDSLGVRHKKACTRPGKFTT